MADGWEPNVVLNNAAITGEMLMGKGKAFPDFADTSVEDFEKTLRTNLTGAFMIARQMDRDIVGRYPATLINVASMYALNGAHHGIYEGMPFKNFSAYGVTKAGIPRADSLVGGLLGQAAGDREHYCAGGSVQRPFGGISGPCVRIDHGGQDGRARRDRRCDAVSGIRAVRLYDRAAGERRRWVFRLVGRAFSHQLVRPRGSISRATIQPVTKPPRCASQARSRSMA